jgi:hypothetical protein
VHGRRERKRKERRDKMKIKKHVQSSEGKSTRGNVKRRERKETRTAKKV